MTDDMDYLLRVQLEELDHFSRFIVASCSSSPASPT
jgi:hypothetical protein